jgi:hypothetical protein
VRAGPSTWTDVNGLAVSGRARQIRREADKKQISRESIAFCRNWKDDDEES